LVPDLLDLELEVLDLELQELDLVQEVPDLEPVVLYLELQVQEEQEGLGSVLDLVQEVLD